jgi:translocator protein
VLECEVTPSKQVKPMNRDIVRQGIVVLSYLLTLLVNALATTGVLGGISTQQIATKYPIYFLPANFTFGIWGIIYLALGAYATYQALPSQRSTERQRAVGWLVVLTGLFNSLWLVSFQNTLFGASMLAMLLLLATLVGIYLRLGIGNKREPRSERLLLTLPFSLYLGWITVATIANASYVLFDAKWDGFGIAGSAWAVIMLIIAGAISLLILVTRQDTAFVLVVVWALAGIWIRQSGTPPVALTAALASVVLLAAVVSVWVVRSRHPNALGA